jgi:hypothetical protein
MHGPKIIAPVLGALIVVGCTFNEPRLGVAPIVSAAGTEYYYPVGDFTVDGIKYTCVEWHSPTGILPQAFMETITGWHSKMNGCVYETANLQTALTGVADLAPDPTEPLWPRLDDPDHPRQIQKKTRDLLAMSDYNCRHFLDGSFAIKSDSSFSSSLMSTILSGTTTVITPISEIPVLVPTAINAGNAAQTSAAAALDSNFFAKQSFDVMAEGIKANRAQRRAEIDARLCKTFHMMMSKKAKKTDKLCDIPQNGDYPGYHPARYYDMGDALSDVIVYDQVCSIQGGLSQLSTAAANKRRQADQAAGLGGTDEKAPAK